MITHTQTHTLIFKIFQYFHLWFSEEALPVKSLPNRHSLYIRIAVLHHEHHISLCATRKTISNGSHPLWQFPKLISLTISRIFRAMYKAATASYWIIFLCVCDWMKFYASWLTFPGLCSALLCSSVIKRGCNTLAGGRELRRLEADVRKGSVVHVIFSKKKRKHEKLQCMHTSTHTGSAGRCL